MNSIKSDAQIRDDVCAELRWDPAASGERIDVAVKDGHVTLRGAVDTCMQKHAIGQAVRRIAGVRGMTTDLEVRLAPGHERRDTEIADTASSALRWHSLVPDDRVGTEVQDGWVTLSGEVDWPYQSMSAELAVLPIVGVRGVTNTIRLKQRARPEHIQADLVAALRRHAEREARHIDIDVDGSVVTLSGHVDSLAEHDAALGTAMATRGVTRVIDRLEVGA